MQILDHSWSHPVLDQYSASLNCLTSLSKIEKNIWLHIIFCIEVTFVVLKGVTYKLLHTLFFLQQTIVHPHLISSTSWIGTLHKKIFVHVPLSKWDAGRKKQWQRCFVIFWLGRVWGGWSLVKKVYLIRNDRKIHIFSCTEPRVTMMILTICSRKLDYLGVGWDNCASRPFCQRQALRSKGSWIKSANSGGWLTRGEESVKQML